jgi:hypothetical protein
VSTEILCLQNIAYNAAGLHKAGVSSFFLFQPMAFYPSSARPSDFFGIIHVFSFSIRRSRHNGRDRRYFSRNLQGGPVVLFGEVATLIIHVFPFLRGGGVTPPRPRYFFKPSPANFTNQSSTSFRPRQIYLQADKVGGGRDAGQSHPLEGELAVSSTPHWPKQNRVNPM